MKKILLYLILISNLIIGYIFLLVYYPNWAIKYLDKDAVIVIKLLIAFSYIAIMAMLFVSLIKSKK